MNKLPSDESPLESCIQRQIKPLLNKGDQLQEGSFFRNLKKSDIAWNYPKSPDHGRRLKNFKNWNLTNDNGQMDFSVNLIDCIQTAFCSIAVQSNSRDYKYVWEISLKKLNSYFEDLEDLGGDAYIAQYAPVEENACHFVVLSLNGILSQIQFISLLEKLAMEFPPEDKSIPKGDRPIHGDETKADIAAAKYRDFVKLHEPLNLPPIDSLII